MKRLLLLISIVLPLLLSAQVKKSIIPENISYRLSGMGSLRLPSTIPTPPEKQMERSAYAGIRAYQNLKVPVVPSHINSTDTLIVGLVPNDTVRITGTWTHTGPIWVFNDGVLVFNNANVIDTGDVYVWGNGQLLADSSTFFFPQNYFYERSLLAIGSSRVVMNNSSFNYSGMSHNLVLGDTTTVQFNNIHQNDWTTSGLWGHANLEINHSNLGGEYILSAHCNAQFNRVDTLLLWHQLPDTAVVNYEFPSTDTVYNYQFDASVPGVAGVAYQVAADSCTDVMWALMPVNGSNVIINNSTIRAIGAWFTQGDTVSIQGIFDNSNYTSYTAPLTDRILQLNNSSVQTWSMYLFDSSQVTIFNCQLGEVGCQSHATVNSQSFLLDGSGGYFWATDTAFTFADQVIVYSTARSERNGIFVLWDSYVPFIAPSAIGSSLMICVQDSFPGEPIAYDGAIVWNQKFSTPDTAYTDSSLAIDGSAWIDQGPQGSWMDFANYSVYYREINDISPTPLVIDSAVEIRHSTLANWNTAGLTPGLYELSLKIRNSLGDTLTSLKQIVLTSPQNSISEADDLIGSVYPNPFSDKVTIEINRNSTFEVSVFDVQSKLVAHRVFENKISLNLSGFDSGTYFYEIRKSGKLVKSGKLLKD